MSGNKSSPPSAGLQLVLDLVRKQTPWGQIPPEFRRRYKLQLGTERRWEQLRVPWALQLHIPHHSNMVMGAEAFYRRAVDAFRAKCMPYPYHYQAEIVSRLGITAFRYYSDLVHSALENEKGFDEIPSFTARECVRLLGIGRNEFIALLNRCKRESSWRRRRGDVARAALPPVVHGGGVSPQPWWIVRRVPGAEAKRTLSSGEAAVLKRLDSEGTSECRAVDRAVVRALHGEGLVFFDVPIRPNDRVIIPRLEGFVMNRLGKDQFEKLMYEVFVTADQSHTVADLAAILNHPQGIVADAVSLHCRLGFARRVSPTGSRGDQEHGGHGDAKSTTDVSFASGNDDDGVTKDRRVALLYDESVVSYLMIGSQSDALKKLSVSMYEVGRLSNADSMLLESELRKVTAAAGEGPEFREYFAFGTAFRHILAALAETGGSEGSRVDLYRMASLGALEPAALARLLRGRYRCIASVSPIQGCLGVGGEGKVFPPIAGPPSSLAQSPWAGLYLCAMLGCGPVSMVFPKGTRVLAIPRSLKPYRWLLIREWTSSEPWLARRSEALMLLNSRLVAAPVLVQGFDHEAGERQSEASEAGCDSSSLVKRDGESTRIKSPNGYPEGTTLVLALGSGRSSGIDGKMGTDAAAQSALTLLRRAEAELGLGGSVGYMRLVRGAQGSDWVPIDVQLGFPVFNLALTESLCGRLREEKLLEGEALIAHGAAMRQFASKLDEFARTHANVAKDEQAFACLKGAVAATAARKSGVSATELHPRDALVFDGRELKAAGLAAR